MSSTLLIDESPLIVQPSLAVLVGLNEAMILQQVHYWLNPKMNKNVFEGRLWVHNTYEQWQKQFPFWGEKTIRRTILSLEKLTILESRVKTFNFKKTKYYTIDYDALESLRSAEKLGSDPSGQNDQIDLPKRADGIGQIDRIDRDNMTRLYNKDTETTSENTLPPQVPSEDEEEKFISIWNEVVQSKLSECSVSLTPRRVELIQTLLRGSAVSDVEVWRTYCQKIASSKFLMGESESGFRVRFDWALDPENVVKVLEGAIYDKPSQDKPQVKSWDEFETDLKRSISCADWRAVCFKFAEITSPVVYEAWLGKVQFVRCEANKAHLKTDSRFIADYIQNNYQAEVLRALRVAYPHVQSIQFSFGGSQ